MDFELENRVWKPFPVPAISTISCQIVILLDVMQTEELMYFSVQPAAIFKNAKQQKYFSVEH